MIINVENDAMLGRNNDSIYATKFYVMQKQIDELQQENKQLKDNWNKLKEWLEKESDDRINPNNDKWLTGVYDAYRETIDKMQEMEGSEINESRFNIKK